MKTPTTRERHNVTLTHNERLSDALNCLVDVLDFSNTATGTHKTLKAEEVLRRVDAKEVIAISSGNYAAALKVMAEETNRMVHIVMGDIDKDSEIYFSGKFTDVTSIQDLVAAKAKALKAKKWLPFFDGQHPEDLTGNQLGFAYRLLKTGEDPWALLKNTADFPVNITNLEDIQEYQWQEHQYVDYEKPLYDIGIPSHFDLLKYGSVFVPTGSGELLHDIIKHGIDRTLPKTSHDERKVGGLMWKLPVYAEAPARAYGVCPSNHPAITKRDFDAAALRSYADKLTTPIYPIQHSQWHFWQNEYLRHSLINATEGELMLAHHLARRAGLNCEPSGAAGCVIAVESFRKRHGIFLQKKPVLIVNTGNGQKFFE